MYKFSEILLDVLEEMEFLTRTLHSAQLYYSDVSEALSMTMRETKIRLLNATLDFAIDLEHKINHQIGKNHLLEQVSTSLDAAAKNLKYFPEEHKIPSFGDIESEIVGIIGFLREYSSNAYDLVKEFSLEERKLLINKTLNIKSRRTI